MPTTTAVDIPCFATTQVHLLNHELAVSIHETSTQLSNSPSALQRAGLAIINLIPISQRTGLGGKLIVELAPDTATNSEGELPAHGLRVGDIVALAEQPTGASRKTELRDLESQGMRGVVVRTSKTRVAVALEDKDGATTAEQEAKDKLLLSQRKVWILKLADEVTHKRMTRVMDQMCRMGEGDYSRLMRVLFGLDSLASVQDVGELEWVNENLNTSQKEAVKFALGSPDVALIHGPPGTGKTQTLIELILQMFKRGLRVLVCGPSNISVDNIVERLAPHKIPMVRLGHPARLLPSVLNHSLDILSRSSDAASIVRDVRKEMDSKQASIRKTKSGKERKQIYTDLRELRKEYREREKKVVGNLLVGCKVVLATLHGAGGFNMRNEVVDVVVIDEASQALEAQSWVPLIRAKKVVLAGDHLQLPPTVKSLNSKAKIKAIVPDKIISGMTLETTLFSRLLKLHGSDIKRMLTVQYRMHEKIMRFPSDELYESLLVAAEGVKKRLLTNLPYEIRETEDTVEPLIFFDTQGGDFPEKNEDESVSNKAGKGMTGDSKSNEMEAALVKFHVGNLIDAGVKAEDIAIITPYNAQLTLMSNSLKDAFPGIELGSVDGFQGREKEAIILSLVRSNPEHEVGFLGDKRRLNVAMTRPRCSLTVIGDSETLQSNQFLKRWIDFLEEHSDLRYPSVTMLNSM
ncbi:DNA polymerase alpha-associated DNA helicase A [Podosphaera aphanis]|nr:DNA polymerase alpha-associated DNA helicase A [Podosphaera aphanis]